MVVKLDKSKAYDRVKREFLRVVMKKMSFAREWVVCIMHCIISVSYSVNVNGRSDKFFHPMQGLRQGDSLNPFLFLLCNEGLSTLLKLAMIEGLLKEAKARKRGPIVSHLLYVDDSILFG